MTVTLPMHAPDQREIGLRSAMPAAAAVSLSLAERDAVVAGVNAADAALARAGRWGVLRLFVDAERSPREDPRLDAVRAYAELRRALLPQGYLLPATSLLRAGFTIAQIAQIDAIIAVARPK